MSSTTCSRPKPVTKQSPRKSSSCGCTARLPSAKRFQRCRCIMAGQQRRCCRAFLSTWPGLSITLPASWTTQTQHRRSCTIASFVGVTPSLRKSSMRKFWSSTLLSGERMPAELRNMCCNATVRSIKKKLEKHMRAAVGHRAWLSSQLFETSTCDSESHLRMRGLYRDSTGSP